MDIEVISKVHSGDLLIPKRVETAPLFTYQNVDTRDLFVLISSTGAISEYRADTTILTADMTIVTADYTSGNVSIVEPIPLPVDFSDPERSMYMIVFF